MTRFGLMVAGVVLALDQLSKWAVLSLVFKGGSQGPDASQQAFLSLDITDFFNLATIWNTGVSFGLFQGQAHAWFLALLAVAIAGGLAVWLFRQTRRQTALALGLLIGGALGNALDRVRFGAVFDFLDFHAFGWHWPAFNLADAAISIGVALLLWETMRTDSKHS